MVPLPKSLSICTICYLYDVNNGNKLNFFVIFMSVDKKPLDDLVRTR